MRWVGKLMIWSSFFFFFFVFQVANCSLSSASRKQRRNVVPLVYRCCVVVPQQALLCLATHHEMPFLFYFYIYFFCLYPAAFIVVQLRRLTLSEAREACTSFSRSPGSLRDLSGDSSKRSRRSFARPCPQTKFAAVSSGFRCCLFFSSLLFLSFVGIDSHSGSLESQWPLKRLFNPFCALLLLHRPSSRNVLPRG